MKFLEEAALRNGASREVAQRIEGANTAREVFFIFKEEGLTGAIRDIVGLVRENAEERSARGVKVRAMLVDYNGSVEVSL